MKHGDDHLRTAWARTLVRRAFALVALAAALASQTGVAAYDVCTDDYAGEGVFSCAHEQMFDEAMRFYTELVPSNRFSAEIIAHGGEAAKSRDAFLALPSPRITIQNSRWFGKLPEHEVAAMFEQSTEKDLFQGYLDARRVQPETEAMIDSRIELANLRPELVRRLRDALAGARARRRATS